MPAAVTTPPTRSSTRCRSSGGEDAAFPRRAARALPPRAAGRRWPAGPGVARARPAGRGGGRPRAGRPAGGGRGPGGGGAPDGLGGEPVALELLDGWPGRDDEARAALGERVAALRALALPGLADVLDHGHEDGTAWVASRWVG